MKKLVFIVAALFAAVGANAQDENNALVSLLKVNFEGASPSNTPTGDNFVIVEPTDEGLALSNPDKPIDFDNWWWSKVVLSDDCLTLQKKHNYIVRLTIKVPHKREDSHFDNVLYTVLVGNNTYQTQSRVGINGDDDFQVVDFEIPRFPYDIEGDGCIAIRPQYIKGYTTTLKEVEVFEEIIPESPVVDGMRLLCEKNWEGIEVSGPIWEFEKPDWDYEGTSEGLALTNATMKGENWAAQVTVVNDFDLEQNHNYIVRLTMKVPSDGTYTLRMGNWSASFLYDDLSVADSDDWQVIDVQFPDFGGDVKYETGNLIENCFVILQFGQVVGTTVIKKVEVYEVLGSSARGGAHAQLGYWNSKGFVELTPDESFTYKYVRSMDAESHEAISSLYAKMKETGDRSIIKRFETGATDWYVTGEWFVRKDYPLPEGNFYESDFYISSLTEHGNEVYIVLPQVESMLSYRGQIDDLLEYLGDRVTIDMVKEEEVGDVKFTDFRFISNLKTSAEWLKLCMDVSDYGFAGLYHHFNPGLIWLNRTYDSHLISELTEANEDKKLIYSRNFEDVEGRWPETDCFPDESNPDQFTYEGTEEGLAITVSQKQEQIWQSQVMVVPDGSFDLEENHDYIVRLTLKVPSDGIYQVNIGTWTNNFQNQVAVTASDDFQVIDVEFPFLGNGAEQIYYLKGCHMLFQCGWMVGTTVLKKVEVYKKVGQAARGGETAIKTVKVANSDDAVYNLAGQRVDASYKGLVIQNGQKRISR